MVDIDLVVVNYRTDEDLVRFSESLRKNSGDISYRLFTMDVHPLPDSIPNVSLRSGDVLHRFGSNVGYGYAANCGAALGDAPLLGIFNADVAFPAGQLENIVKAMQAHPDWSILGPRQINSDGLITHAGYIGPNEEPIARAWRTPVGMTEWVDTIPCTYVMGSAFFVRREVWDELTDCAHNGGSGAFLETPLYFEETWCCYHARAHGFKVMYYGEATLIHEWHGAIRNTDPAEEGRKLQHASQMFDAACRTHGIKH